jgi:hypothetical protein
VIGSTTFVIDRDDRGEPLSGVRTYVWRFERTDLDGLGHTWSVATEPATSTVHRPPSDGGTRADEPFMLWPWRDEPHDPAKRATWIATPPDAFSLVLTVAGEDPAWAPPPVRRFDP